MLDQAEIHKRVMSSEVRERRAVVEQLRDSFVDLHDKERLWEYLHRLTEDEDSGVRQRVVETLGDAFQYVPDRKQVWIDLHRLIKDEDSGVRQRATYVLGFAFQYIPEKEEAWDDLIRLTWDEDRSVRVSANHSRGRASTFKATEAESKAGFRDELENAIEFFEASSKEATYHDPSSFCLPFYRSFYTITFKKAGAEGEVHRYLSEAKSAVRGSESKEILLEAVANLANALSEAQKTREPDLDTLQGHLCTYRQYCDRAADLIGAAAEGAPGAARVLRRALPIIGERIREIQETAEALCRETQGTPLEELGLVTYRTAQELATQDPLALTRSIGNMASSARALCELIPTDDERIHACEQLKNMSGLELSEQSRTLAEVLEYITTCLHSHIRKHKNIKIKDSKK